MDWGTGQGGSEPKELILRSNRLSTALHVGDFGKERVSDEQCQGLPRAETARGFSYGPLLLPLVALTSRRMLAQP